MKFMIQGSGGTIGDIFLSSHPVFNHYRREPFEVHVAIPKTVDDSIRDIYRRHKFLSGIHELDDIREGITPYCQENGFIPILFLHAWGSPFYTNVTFNSLDLWFDKPDEPTVTQNNTIIFHVSSSANFERPKIPFFEHYLNYVIQSGFFPVFIGTEKDEKSFVTNYPNIRSIIPDELWRFGKDTVQQTMSNISRSEGCIAFSSWSSIYAALCKKPVIEIWNFEQWLFYNNIVKYLIGSPIHMYQNSYMTEPYNVHETLAYARQLAMIY